MRKSELALKKTAEVLFIRKVKRNTWGPRGGRFVHYAMNRKVKWGPDQKFPQYLARDFGLVYCVEKFQDLMKDDILLMISNRYDNVFDVRKPMKRFNKTYLNTILYSWRISIE